MADGKPEGWQVVREVTLFYREALGLRTKSAIFGSTPNLSRP